MQDQIAKRGLDDYVDHEIAGTPITRTDLLYMIDLGGAGGAQRVLWTQGRANPRDANADVCWTMHDWEPHGRGEPSRTR
jgi:hypothetical protein